MELKLKQLRKRHSVTQADLAKVVGVDPTTVGNWERGKTIMNAQQIWDCCLALETDPNTLLGWYDEHPEDLPHATQEERALLDSYRSANDTGRAAIEAVARVSSGEEAPPRVSRTA